MWVFAKAPAQHRPAAALLPPPTAALQPQPQRASPQQPPQQHSHFHYSPPRLPHSPPRPLPPLLPPPFLHQVFPRPLYYSHPSRPSPPPRRPRHPLLLPLPWRQQGCRQLRPRCQLPCLQSHFPLVWHRASQAYLLHLLLLLPQAYSLHLLLLPTPAYLLHLPPPLLAHTTAACHSTANVRARAPAPLLEHIMALPKPLKHTPRSTCTT